MWLCKKILLYLHNNVCECWLTASGVTSSCVKRRCWSYMEDPTSHCGWRRTLPRAAVPTGAHRWSSSWTSSPYPRPPSLPMSWRFGLIRTTTLTFYHRSLYKQLPQLDLYRFHETFSTDKLLSCVVLWDSQKRKMKMFLKTLAGCRSKFLGGKHCSVV